jgi:hypothetical protein
MLKVCDSIVCLRLLSSIFSYLLFCVVFRFGSVLRRLPFLYFLRVVEFWNANFIFSFFGALGVESEFRCQETGHELKFLPAFKEGQEESMVVLNVGRQIFNFRRQHASKSSLLASIFAAPCCSAWPILSASFLPSCFHRSSSHLGSNHGSRGATGVIRAYFQCPSSSKSGGICTSVGVWTRGSAFTTMQTQSLQTRSQLFNAFRKNESKGLVSLPPNQQEVSNSPGPAPASTVDDLGALGAIPDLDEKVISLSERAQLLKVRLTHEELTLLAQHAGAHQELRITRKKFIEFSSRKRQQEVEREAFLNSIEKPDEEKGMLGKCLLPNTYTYIYIYYYKYTIR